MTFRVDIHERLSQNDWFAGRSEALRRSLCEHGVLRQVLAGQWIYSQGDALTGLCAVISGTLRLEVAEGNDTDVLLKLGTSPRILGHARGYGGGPRMLTARAQTDATLFMVSSEALDRIGASSPRLWLDLNELAYEQIGELVGDLARFLVLPTKARVATILLRNADGDTVFATQSDIAEMCGLSRKVVAEHLAILEKTGAIKRSYGKVKLTDLRTLSTFSAA
ncbi:MAG: Crp/Fnr family transcriptional regulator [Novosphingobium sp.]